jgi:hypothetical protein
MGIVEDKNKKRSRFVHLPFAVVGLEQSMPADAVLAKEGTEEVSGACCCWGGYTEFFFLVVCLLVLARYRSCCHAMGIITFEDILEGTFFLILSLQTKHPADSKMSPQNSSVKKSTTNSIRKAVKRPMSLPRSITSTKTTYTASISTPPSSARKNRLHSSHPQTPLNTQEVTQAQAVRNHSRPRRC